jgi:hypothetical protein
MKPLNIVKNTKTPHGTARRLRRKNIPMKGTDARKAWDAAQVARAKGRS